MSDIPVRPPPPPPPLPPGWTEHKAPSGHSYYYNTETKKSTYTRPVPEIAQYHQPTPPAAPASYSAAPNYSAYPDAQPAQNTFQPQPSINDFIFASAPKQFPKHGGAQQQGRGGHRGGMRGGHNNFNDRRREKDDRPKHRQDIPNCAPWVLVKTKFGRRFVWNKDTNESFWKFPPNVMTAVIEFDRREREKKERRERGEPSDVEEDHDAMAEIEAELAEAEEEIEIVEVDGEEGMENDEEYEEVEVTDDEGEQSNATKRQRTEEPSGDQPQEMGDDDLAWQLAQMEEMEMGGDYDDQYDDEEPALSEEDCKALFKELLDDTKISPFTQWDKILEDGVLFDDERYKALPTMAARKECFNEWSRDKAQFLKEEKARQSKRDPRIPYLAMLDRYATPKLYWPEFRRKYKKEPEMRDTKLSDKDKEKLYRDHIKRLAMRSSELKSDLSVLLRAQPLALLNRSTTLDTLPSAVLSDLRFISLPPSTRDSLITTYISTLPPAPEGVVYSAEEEAERAKKWAERERREKALADRERRVREEKRKQERDLEYGKGRLREEEMEIEKAMNVGKEGLKAYLKE
ncbi:FF domain containing protein [Pyrenophora tritici-repentis]|nr:FF domain containing protein [Pyrenophora tritici-repentis]